MGLHLSITWALTHHRNLFLCLVCEVLLDGAGRRAVICTPFESCDLFLLVEANLPESLCFQQIHQNKRVRSRQKECREDPNTFVHLFFKEGETEQNNKILVTNICQFKINHAQNNITYELKPNYTTKQNGKYLNYTSVTQKSVSWSNKVS